MLAGLAVGLAVVGCAGHAVGGVRTMEVSFDARCVLKTSSPKRAQKRKNDVLLFTFKNACAAEQTLHVCALPADGQTVGPWHECQGLPLGRPARLGAPFVIAAATRGEPAAAQALCSVDYPAGVSFPKKKFCLYVATAGSPDPPLTCPPAGQECKGSRGSELALEVEP